MPTKTKLSIEELSALYDRIYDIADRLLKKYNPCKIQKTLRMSDTNKVETGLKCSYTNFEYSLCCRICTNKYWNKYTGCTTKCLSCKLFLCNAARKNNPILSARFCRLENYARKHNLPTTKYYRSKRELLALAIQKN